MDAHFTAMGDARREPADVARRRVLEQHRELRRMLSEGLQHMSRALDGGRSAEYAFRRVVGVSYHAFLEHLADEEALILPILDDDLPLGPERALRLREEHDRQRSDFEALYAFRTLGELGDLTGRFGALATALLEDIAHEERELITPEVIRDDGVVIDQSGG